MSTVNEKKGKDDPARVQDDDEEQMKRARDSLKSIDVCAAVSHLLHAVM